MKTVGCWNDLQPFGVEALTGEACSLSYRILFDVTEKGRKLIGKCFGIPDMKLGEAWNRGTAEAPHVGSIMLSQEMLVPLGIFALLENGCREVYILNGTVVGLEPGDPADTLTTMCRVLKTECSRRFSYGGPGAVGDRNVHQMSGRID
jgi:hypothetical protein